MTSINCCYECLPVFQSILHYMSHMLCLLESKQAEQMMVGF